MKLNHDCIRDLMLFIESLPYSEPAFNDIIFQSNRMKKYSEDEINYVISKIGNKDAQLIIGEVKFASNKPYMTYVSDLTFKGHEYLDNIRDPKVWKETKKVASKLSSVSIDIMSQIAANIISKMMGLN